MSTSGEPPPPPPDRPQPPAYPPPPPTYPPPAPRPQAYGPPQLGPTGYVDVDPTSAGLVREERLGWALPFAVLGSLTMVAALFMPWVEVKLSVLYQGGVTGPLEDRTETAGIFSAIDTVKEVTSPDPERIAPAPLAHVVFPWLALGLTAALGLLVLASAVGLRRRALTTTARIVTALLAHASFVILAMTFTPLGFGDGTVSLPRATTSPETDLTPYFGTRVEMSTGVEVWFLGALLVFIGGCLGPRIVHTLPPGAQPSYGGPYGGPGGSPGWAPGAGHPGLVRRTTQVVAIVLMSIASVLCLAGYTFVSWAPSGDTVTFSDIGEAARDGGFGDKAFAEAYFAWLGWLVLALVLVATLLVVLGKKPTGVNPQVVRPFVAIGIGLSLVAHVAALGELGGDAGTGAGAIAIALGLGVGFVGALLPLRTTARIGVGARATGS